MGARAALPVNPHVADGFLTEKPPSPQSRSNLNLAKPIMVMRWVFSLPEAMADMLKSAQKGLAGLREQPRSKERQRTAQPPP